MTKLRFGHHNNTYDVEGQRIQTGPFGEMAVNGGSTATVIDATDTLHQIKDFATGEVNDVTFTASIAVAIASIADAGDGDITVTTGTDHGFAVGDIVNHTGTSNYNDRYTILTVPSTTTYTVTETFGSTETGTAIKGDLFTIEKAGKYKCSFSVSATSAAASKVFEFVVSLNGTAESKSRVSHAGLGTVKENLSGQCVLDCAVGDEVRLEVIGKTDTTNITINEANFIIEML